MVLIDVTINGALLGRFTPEAYEALRLGFSTGDFHVHKAKLVVIPNPEPSSYIDLEQLLENEHEY